MDANQAATEIMEVLRRLPTPRHAAAAISVVRANLHLQAGGNTEAKARKMIEDDDRATLEIWTSILEPLGMPARLRSRRNLSKRRIRND